MLARADLETLLRARKLDVTLTSARPVPVSGADGTRVRTGDAALDVRLGGGFPRGALSEIVGAPSCGRSAVLCALLASATREGELAALIDTDDVFDPPSGARAGVELSRLLWLRGTALDAARPPAQPARAGRERVWKTTLVGVEQVVRRAIRAMHLVVQAGGFGVVALDLADVPPEVLRRMPATTWRRVQRALEGRDTLGVLLASAHVARGAGGVTLSLERTRRDVRWHGTSDRARRLAGITIQAAVGRARFIPGDEAGVVLTVQEGA